MLPQSLGLLVLFLWVQRAVTETEVMGIIGKPAELRCHYLGDKQFSLNEFRILWQIPEKPACYVGAYYRGPEKSHQCKDFSSRTVFNGKLDQGDFSLQLLNISQKDEHTYDCIVLRNTNGLWKHLQQTSATLKVAANYSEPVLTGPVESEEEIRFTCNSSHGYPKPKVYWINQTDNSLLNAAQLEITQETDGTFSIFSTLTIKAASAINVGCIIENKLLNQSLTAMTIADMISPTNSPRTEFHQSRAVMGTVVATIIIIIAIILYIVWYKRKHDLRQTYTDVCQGEEKISHNTPVETKHFQRPWTAGEVSRDVEVVP